MARIEVILQPEQRHLQEAVMELSNDAQHMMSKNMERVMRISLPMNVNTQRLDDLGVEYKKPTGRPADPEYQGVIRKPITIQWPASLISAIDERVPNRTKWLIQAAEEKFQRDFGEV
jgi:hypothetical protein